MSSREKTSPPNKHVNKSIEIHRNRELIPWLESEMGAQYKSNTTLSDGMTIDNTNELKEFFLFFKKKVDSQDCTQKSSGIRVLSEGNKLWR